MFDPTIYENLKVVLEGAVYDLDLDHKIIVCNRKDIIDLASMSRSYHIEFKLRQDEAYPRAEIILYSGMSDLALEIRDGNEAAAGCILEVNFYTNRVDCNPIKNTIENIWGFRPHVEQRITYIFGKESEKENKINLSFGRKINENQIEDLQDFIHFTNQTLLFLNQSKEK